MENIKVVTRAFKIVSISYGNYCRKKYLTQKLYKIIARIYFINTFDRYNWRYTESSGSAKC